MTLHEAIGQYILWRQAHGAKFTTGANLLRHFLGYADGDAGCDAVTTAQVLAFLAGKGPLTRQRENKYYALAGFWRHAISRGHAIRSPLPNSEPKSPPRTPPYIYSHDELRRLFDPMNLESSRRGAVQLDAVTFRTLLLLLYGAGLRFSEATGLTLTDVDLAEAILTIRATKFYKSRLVPIGSQLATVLADYIPLRRRGGLAQGETSFLPSGEPGRHSARQQHRSVRLRRAAAYRRSPWHGRRATDPTPARSPAQLRGSQPDCLVSSGSGCATVATRTLHLSRPCQSGGHQGLSVDDAGPSSAGIATL
ncbi:phage integrase family protein [Aquabacter spiritensis]|uniref:Phage integrase family protein n=1 Tax=Aquabacter spiritensis TaxID=933073 RepID=A0A4R3LKV3_9HYPH|nr:site-specific integrase [Aquabacter spiritensis]TCT00186.1 phage integrase family protein [Aquabacter spiritensis]